MARRVDDFINHTPFKNLKVLRSDYVPSDLEYREDELEKLARDVFAAPFNDQIPENTFIYGQSGTGKTVCVKYWLDKVRNKEKKSDKVIFRYINCKEISSAPRLIKRLAEELKGEAVKSKKGIKYYMDIITEEAEGKTVVFILDEIDRIFDSKTTITGDDILYNLLRARESGRISEGYISVVGISNKMNIKEKMSEGTISSFGTNWMSFDPYKHKQIYKILQDRAKKGIKDFDGLEGVLDKIANYVAKLDGDARTAIDVLRHAGKIAEKRESTGITFEDVEESKYRAQKENIMEDVRRMTDSQRLTFLSLLIVVYNEDKPTKKNTRKAYMQLKEHNEIDVPILSRKQIGRYLKEMRKRDLLDIEVDHNSRGRPALHVPCVSGKLLKKLAKELLEGFDRGDKYGKYFQDDSLKESEKEVLELAGGGNN